MVREKERNHNRSMKDKLSTSKRQRVREQAIYTVYNVMRKGSAIGVTNHSLTIRCWSGVVFVVSLDGEETKLDEAPLV